MIDSAPPEPAPHTCPICRQPVDKDSDHFPFCSQRCRYVDLGKWLDEGYRVESRPQDDD